MLCKKHLLYGTLPFQSMEVTLSGLRGASVLLLVEVAHTPEQDLAQHQLLKTEDERVSNKAWV